MARLRRRVRRRERDLAGHRAGGGADRRGGRRPATWTAGSSAAAGRAGVHPAVPVRRARRARSQHCSTGSRRTSTRASARAGRRVGGRRWPTRRGPRAASALLLAARALARAEGVEEALLAEWALSQPGLAEQSDRAAGSAAAKGWRWVGRDGGDRRTHGRRRACRDGFHQAAAEIYRRSARRARPRHRPEPRPYGRATCSSAVTARGLTGSAAARLAAARRSER